MDETKVKQLMSFISSNTQRITQNVNQITSMLQVYGTPKDSLQHREKTFEIIKATGTLGKETFQKIKELKNFSQIINRDSQLRIQQERLTDAFSRALNGLQEREKELTKKLPIPIQETNNVRDIQLIDIGSDDQNNSRAAFFNNESFESKQQKQESISYDQVRQVEENNEALRSLEKDIVDVNTIFKDLAILVHDQGEVIDSIEKNIENTSDNVKQANVQLTSAVRYQTKARRKKFILVIILLIVLLVVGLIVYFSIPKKK